MENYESSLDTQTLDAKRLEVERCAYLNCGYTFLDIHSHYWQFHLEYIKPNMRKANCTKDTVTKFQESNVNQIGSDLEEDTESVDKAKPQREQEVISTQSAKNNSQEAPEVKTGLKLVPALKYNKEIGTKNRNDEAIQVEEKEHVDATKTQNKQPLSTKYESDTGTPDSKKDVKKDKKG